jgi:triosephosphate isomerase
MSPWIIGNWKANGSSAAVSSFCGAVIQELSAADNAALCLPSVYIGLADQTLSALGSHALKLGAEDVSRFSAGAFTGENTAVMLEDCGASMAIIGHSERRRLFHEDYEILAEKVKLALDAALTPIFCVGETEEERASGSTRDVLEDQLSVVTSLKSLPNLFNRPSMIVAYEPVWAIGSGKAATPEDIALASGAIRGILSASAAKDAAILYGGSVSDKNIGEILAVEGVGGALVGGASLDVEKFLRMVETARQFA